MSTLTPRMSLTKPDPTDSMALGDNILSDNYDRIDDSAGMFIGAAPPSLTFNGKLWNDTASQNESKLQIPGPSWEYIGSENNQRGFKGYELDSVERQTTGEITLFTVSFPSTAGRKYLVEYSIFQKWVQPAAGEHTLLFKKADNTVIKTQKNYISSEGDSSVLGISIAASFEYVETIDGTAQIKMNVSASGTGLTALLGVGGAQTTMLVHDWGNN